MPLAARENELCLVASLYFCAQQCLHVLLRILTYLLELIDGNDARLVRLVDVIENLIQCGLGNFDVAKADVKGGRSCHCVEFEAHAKGGDDLEETFPPHCWLGLELVVDLLAQHIDKFRERGGGVYVYVEDMVLLLDVRLVE